MQTLFCSGCLNECKGRPFLAANANEAWRIDELVPSLRVFMLVSILGRASSLRTLVHIKHIAGDGDDDRPSLHDSVCVCVCKTTHGAEPSRALPLYQHGNRATKKNKKKGG